MTAPDRAAELAFEQKVSRLQRAVLGAAELVDETAHRLDEIDKSLPGALAADPGLPGEVRGLRERLRAIDDKLNGDKLVARHSEPTMPGILARLQNAITWGQMVAPTHTAEDSYRVAARDFGPLLADLRQLVEVDMKRLDERLEAAGAPWTPGRVPRWKPE